MYNLFLKKYYEDNKINFDDLDNINVSKFASFIHTVNLWSQILGFLVFQCDDYKKRKKEGVGLPWYKSGAAKMRH